MTYSQFSVKINYFRGGIVYLLSKRNPLLVQDFARWCEILQISGSNLYRFTWFLMKTPEFRNVVLLRFKNERNFIKYAVTRILFKPNPTLHFCCEDIGGGLFIQHGDATYIGAKRIGKNFWCNQQVTIGFTNATDCPVIEDNCRVSVGAIVLGDVHLGKNSTVGAGAVVLKDVPEGATVVGVPAKPINK